MLEGAAHAVAVAFHDDFRSHQGSELNRKPLGEVLRLARPHLPAELVFFVDSAKKLGDLHHHNQGEPPASSPRTAQAMLLQAATLLEWLYRDVLVAEPPAELAAAVDDLHDRQPARAPATSSRPLLVAAVAGCLVALGAGGWALWSARQRPEATAPRPAPGSAFNNLGQPERGWIEAYQNALDSRDVDRLVGLHVIPARRFFMAKNYDGPRLRKLFQGWYDRAGPDRRTGFDHCSIAHVAADEGRSLRCDTYIDPPFPDGGPSRAGTCLVFTPEGKVLSRTETAQIPDCPPP